jgi:ectoine hydroxylase-related dioxygenase (phytanoyl-CoA dioxygenase family)
LPWHKDLTIAVRQHRPSLLFVHPTVKAGVPHVEAPRQVLEKMLALRIHLDEVTAENGPLQVIPGSHRQGTEMELGATKPVSIFANRGDVLLIRPLVAHCSGGAEPGTQRHRRIFHLEFATSEKLPEDFEWNEFDAESNSLPSLPALTF